MNKIIQAVFAITIGLTGFAAAQTQEIFLDFDTGTDGSIVYTTTMRDDIEALMEGHYVDFDVTFTQDPPVAGDFSTLTFNSGGPGGLADKIDFRNLDPNDNAVVNIEGLGLVATADIVSASAVIGSHEIGHLLGLRHGDSFGPIGDGIKPGLAGSYFPAYPGPTGADETDDHIMASPASVGSTVADATTPSWFSERSATKLANNENGTLQNEGVSPTALSFDSMAVPNTIVSGDNAGATFTGRTFTARGDISVTGGEVDTYTFEGCAGQNFNFEVISRVISHRLPGTIDSQIRILDSSAMPVDYYSTSAFNDDELEGFDSILIDLVLPANDTYTVSVQAFGATDTGDYELFGHTLDQASCVPGACCTDGPNLGSDCIEVTKAECDQAGPQGGLFMEGVTCDQVDDCVALFVSMDTMSAELTSDGVLVSWATAMEIDTIGFRILREMPADRGREKSMVVVAEGIPAQGSSLQGAQYSFLDNVKGASQAQHYYLEDIDIFGKTTRHGPILIERGQRRAGRAARR